MTVTHRMQSQTATQRDAWIEINLSTLERNYKKIKDLVKTSIMAVVKADAYGHGATTISPILQSLGIHSFGVATVDEGIALRKAGIKVPIVILGATPFWSYESCYKNNLTITIYSVEQGKQLQDFAKSNNYKIPIQIKVDTGMSRLGIDYNNSSTIIKELIGSNNFKTEGIFSHLADSKDYDFSKLQRGRFEQALSSLKDLKIQKHIANSYAAINYEDFKYDLVRVGIALYGQEFNFLEPLLTLKGRITRLHKIQKGEYVSYERKWQAQRDSLIATIPIGYADGIDKNLSNKIIGKHNDKKIKQIGNITMDQMIFDVSEIKEPRVGDVITLLDKDLSISNWASELNAITYDLICRLRMRLPRVYVRD